VVSRRHRAAWVVGGLLCALIVWPPVGRAFSNVAVGDAVDSASMRTLDGRRHDLWSKKAQANVFVFFRPKQEHSLDTLKAMVECEKEFAAKPVHWVAVVSDSWPADEVKATVSEARLDMPVLIDEGDALYGKLGVRLHPVVGILDGKGKLSAYEPFREINYCERVRGEIRFALGEITREELKKVENPEKTVMRTDEGVARRHLNFAKQLMRIGDPAKAMEEVRRSLEISPSAPAYGFQAKLLAEQGKCAEALPAAEAALKIDPAEPSALEGKKRCGK